MHAGILWYFNKRQRTAEKEKDKKEALHAQSFIGGPPSQFGAQYNAPPPGSYGQNGAPNWGPPPGEFKGGYPGSAPGSVDRTNFSNASSTGGPEGHHGYAQGYGPPPPGAYSGVL